MPSLVGATPTPQSPFPIATLAGAAASIYAAKSVHDKLTKTTDGEKYSLEKDANFLNECTRDTRLAQSLIGTPIIKYFEEDDPGIGKVVDYFVLDEEGLEGCILHVIEYESSDVQGHDHYTFKELMSAYHDFTTFHHLPRNNLDLNSTENSTLPTMPRESTNSTPSDQQHGSPIPIPTSLQSYTVLYSKDNEIRKAKIVERTASTDGLHMWKLSHL